MYDKLLKGLERDLESAYNHITVDYSHVSIIADLIIKIKTIQAMDVSADLIRASMEVGKN